LPELASNAVMGSFADAVLCAHVGVAGFVVLGQAAIIAGGLAGQTWVRNFRFRAAHLVLIVFIAVQTSLGQLCPLTELEQFLRQRAGQTAYSESFTQHWLQSLIFFDAPWWTFTALHSFAALVVVGSWLLLPPAWPPLWSKSWPRSWPRWVARS
jgi:Protein of Unknown function (DUF2784)